MKTFLLRAHILAKYQTKHPEDPLNCGKSHSEWHFNHNGFFILLMENKRNKVSRVSIAGGGEWNLRDWWFFFFNSEGRNENGQWQTEVNEIIGQCGSLLCAKIELYNIALNSFPRFMTIVSHMKPVQNSYSGHGRRAVHMETWRW